MSKAILIQARMSSQRFPRKMLQPIVDGVPLVEYVYNRCLQSKRADYVAIITSEDQSDDELFNDCINKRIAVYRGSLNCVLDRYIKTAQYLKAGVVCRVCGDTPFVDVALIDSAFGILENRSLEYVSPDRKTCASGFYFEVMTLEALEKVSRSTKSPENLEHVTKYILDNKAMFKTELLNVELNPEFLKNIRFTVDEPKDIYLCRKIAAELIKSYDFTSQDVLGAIKRIEGF